MVDYSKWKDIEISDDEDDTHPNVDTASLFRWRHQARVERMAETNKEKEELAKAKKEHQKKMQEIKQKLSGTNDMSDLKVELEELEKQHDDFKKKEEELTKKEKLAPWNVDTISKEGFTKTVINRDKARKKNELSEEEREERYAKFSKENEKFIKEYGMLRKYDDSKRFLQEHQYLACEDTANYLVVWCIQLAMEEKIELMEHVAHQCICMQYILELAKQLEVDPRSCISAFFSRIQIAEKSYIDSFDDELQSFKRRIHDRAQIRIEKAMKEAEEEERRERLGPGGLDPVEVFESLPPEMQECFEGRDIGMLQQVISTMPEDEAREIMKRCVDSGLWVPDAKQAEAEAAATGTATAVAAAGNANADAKDEAAHTDAKDEAANADTDAAPKDSDADPE